MRFLPSYWLHSGVMKSFVEMHVVITIMLVIVTQGVVPGCYEFCKVICLSSHRPLALWRPDCNCLDLHKSESKEPTSLYEDSGIYYEPDKLYAYQSIPLVDQPFYILNPITTANPNTIKSRNKIRSRDTAIKEDPYHKKAQIIRDRKLVRKYKRKDYSDYQRRTEPNNFPLYLDIDILESIDDGKANGQEVFKSEIGDFRLVEKDLSECINLHLIYNSRKDGKVMNTTLNADIRHLENMSDADLKIEIENKCIEPASVVSKSLHEIKETWPKKSFSTTKFNKTIKEDPLLIMASMQRHGSNISKQPIFKPVETVELDNNTIISQDTNLPVTSISRTMNNKPHDDEKQTVNTTQNQKDDLNLLKTDFIYTPRVVYSVNTDFTTITYDKLITKNPDDVDNPTRSLEIHGYHIANKDGSHTMDPVDEKEIQTFIAPTTDKHLLDSSQVQSKIIDNNDTKTYSHEIINILTNQDEGQNIVNVSFGVSSHADSDKASADTVTGKPTNRSEYLEEHIQIPKIITREYSNETVTSIISGNEILPNLDYVKVGDNMEQTMDFITTKSDARLLERPASTSTSTESLENSNIKESQEINLLQTNTLEVTGMLYFLYGQQKVPARFVQNNDGKLTIGIDGFSLCDDLTQKQGNKSVLMTTLCKCALSPNCTNSTHLADEVLSVSNN